MTDNTEETGDVELPYDKRTFGKLIGYVEDGDQVIINSIAVRAITSFNIYIQINNFYKLREEQGVTDTPMVFEFSSWLCNNGFIQDTVTETLNHNPLIDFFKGTPQYNVVPFHPSYSDILWTARILQDATSFYTAEDIFHLAMYRGMVIDNLDVENIVKARVHDDILSLAIHLKDSHDKRISEVFSTIKD